MFEYLFDIAVLGSENVGKKSLAKSQFLEKLTNLNEILTIGWEFSTKTVKIDETGVKLCFLILSHKKRWWDKPLKGYLENLVRRSHGAIILYDISNPNSREKIPQWIQIVKDNAGDIPIFLVGNKLDVKEQSKILKEQIQTIKNDYNIASVLEISVKTGENVENMIVSLTRMMLKNCRNTYQK